jgi:hypothetical protein
VPNIVDSPSIERKDWDAVQQLITEVQQLQLTTVWIAAVIRFWDVAVGVFRVVERERLFELTPTEGDLKLHKALLDSLIKLGQALEARVKGIDDEDLAELGVGRENLSAYVRELEDTFLMWHGPELDPARAAELKKTIFGALA